MKLSARQAVCLILLAGIAVYANSFWGVFQMDDFLHITLNPNVWNLQNPSAYLLQSCRPLVLFSLSLNYAVSGFNAWSYHLLNLLVHLGAASLLFDLIRRSLLLPVSGPRWKPHATELAFAAALIWTVHPIQAQSVTYIIQRAESMMGFFYLLTLYGLLRSTTAAHSGRWKLLSVIACFLGMATKPVMVTAPLLTLVYDKIFLAGSWKTVWEKRRSYYGLLAGSWFFLGLLLFFGRNEFLANAGYSYDKLTWLEYARTQPEVLLHYLKIIVWPRGLVLDYGWPVAHDWKQILLATLAVGGLLAVTLRWLQKKPVLGFLGLWFFLILAPTSSIIPIADLAFDHRLYLPMAAMVLLLVLTAAAVLQKTPTSLVPHRRIVGWIILLSVVTGFSIMTISRNQLYQNEVLLWQDVLAKRPPTARAYSNLSSGLLRLKRYDEGIAAEKKSLELDPQQQETALMNIGYALLQKQEFKEAEQTYQQLLQVEPDFARGHLNLGDTLIGQGRFSEAVAHYRTCLSLDPRMDTAYVRLGFILQRQQKEAEAMALYQKALQINPRSAEACNNIGTLYYGKNEPQEALRWFQKAASNDPNYTEARNNAKAVSEQLQPK